MTEKLSVEVDVKNVPEEQEQEQEQDNLIYLVRIIQM